ncbi:unnamed protein product [Allacma fusca]|uniref:Adiponectin receptor protein n=1 Tax=Allacma fusca TaxID=39272 RepID=A0A8J2KMA5_9HEXA|nr:unnamed protein product [Allacma fusca]
MAEAWDSEIRGETEARRRHRIFVNAHDGFPHIDLTRRADGQGDQDEDSELNPKELNRKLECLDDYRALDFPAMPDLFDDNLDDELEEGGGLTLPATPLETPSDTEVDPELLNREEDMDEYDFCIPQLTAATEQVEEFAKKVWAAGWNCCHFKALPRWLQDNDFLHRGHRPPLPSVVECLKSIFRLHTETGNIWTHLLGCLAFLVVAIYFLSRPRVEIDLQEKLVFAVFFVGAIACLFLSSAFHTLHCHSEFVGKLFSKLDYVGIALLIMGSFFPWLYYGFYCEKAVKFTYMSVTFVLGITSIIVSLWDRFGEPHFRPLRAGLFAGFGLSGVIPAVHYALAKGWIHAISRASLGWLILMGVLYILGALVYASRIPERWFPGKCDIWFHSHQLFHILVIAAAFVHYYGICEMAMHRLAHGECDDHPYEAIVLS